VPGSKDAQLAPGGQAALILAGKTNQKDLHLQF
jgi:hypothetical protein